MLYVGKIEVEVQVLLTLGYSTNDNSQGTEEVGGKKYIKFLYRASPHIYSVSANLPITFSGQLLALPSIPDITDFFSLTCIRACERFP